MWMLMVLYLTSTGYSERKLACTFSFNKLDGVIMVRFGTPVNDAFLRL